MTPQTAPPTTPTASSTPADRTPTRPAAEAGPAPTAADATAADATAADATAADATAADATAADATAADATAADATAADATVADATVADATAADATAAAGTATPNLPALIDAAPGPERVSWADVLLRIARVADSSLTLAANLLGRAERLVVDVQRDTREVAVQSSAFWDVASASASKTRDALAAAPRFGRIVREVLRVLASYELHRVKAAVLTEAGAAAELDALHALNGARIHDLCQELGGGILKVGQLLSARPDVLPVAFVAELRGLQDRATPEPFEHVAAALEEELGRPLGEIFETFEEVPVAAASLAQVHRATLPGGRVVAVKIRRPGVEAVLAVDLAAMRAVAGPLHDRMPGVDVPTIVELLATSVLAEVDFEAEGAALTEFGQCFAGDSRLIVPAAHPTASSRGVLTMDFVEGAPLGDYLDSCSPAQRDAICRILVDCTARQILDVGVVHADPHPGNFLVAPPEPGCTEPRLVVLDFGNVARLDRPARHAWASLLGALLGRDVPRSARLLEQLGFSMAGDEGLEPLASSWIDAFFGAGAGAFDLTSVDTRAQLEQGMELIRRHPGVKVPPALVAIGRALGTIGGLLVHHRPEIDLFRLVMPHLGRAIRPL